VESVARSALAALATEANIILACQWVSDRYAQLAGKTTLPSLRRTGALTIPAAMQAGTVALTQGSNTVIGDATAAAAWTADLVGRYFQVAEAWYKITDRQGATLILETPIVEATQATTAYRIVARYLPLADDVRRLGTFELEERRWRIKLVSLQTLDVHHPIRWFTTSGPTMVAEFGSDPQGRKLCEFYPYSSVAMHCTYRYVARPPILEQRDTIPGSIDGYVLKEGVLIDVMRYNAAKKAQQGDINTAGFWRNEARVQEGKYEDLMLRAIQSDRGSEAVEVWLRASGWPQAPSVIRDAHDQLAAVGP